MRNFVVESDNDSTLSSPPPSPVTEAVNNAPGSNAGSQSPIRKPTKRKADDDAITPVSSPKAIKVSDNTPQVAASTTLKKSTKRKTNKTIPASTSSLQTAKDSGKASEEALPQTSVSTAASKTAKRKAPENVTLAAPPKKAAKPTPASTPTATSARPTRARKAPARFEDTTEKHAAKPRPAPKASSKVFDPTFITTHSKSRLAKPNCDLYHLLCEDSAWSSLTADQQQGLIKMLPPTAANTSLLAKFVDGDQGVDRPKELAAYRDILRTDVAKFQEDLSRGHYGKRWQQEAEQACLDRKEGKFDQWKAEEMERWWGQKSGA